MSRAKPAGTRWKYEGGFDAIEVRAGGDWVTATKGDIVTVTGAQHDAFAAAPDFVQVDENGDPVKARRSTKKVDD